MASGINKVILIGNLGRDPEVQHFDNGVNKATFTLATTEPAFKGKDGEKVQHTEWHNIVLWRGLADVAERFLKKGIQFISKGGSANANMKTKRVRKSSFMKSSAIRCRCWAARKRMMETDLHP